MAIKLTNGGISGLYLGSQAVSAAYLGSSAVYTAISPPDAPTDVAITVEDDFAPDQLTGLQLWLDASDASTLYDATTGGSLVAANGGVARWEDKSGNNRHATQGTAGSRPARKTAIQGGLDVLRFDGSDDQLSVPSSTATFKFLHSTDATVFVAFKPGTTTDPNVIYPVVDTCNRGFNTPGYTLSFDDRAPSLNNALRVAVYETSSPYDVISASTNDKITPNAFSVVTATTKPAAETASRFSARTNGGAAYGVNAATGTADTNDSYTDLTISGRNTGEDVLDGDICEIIIYNSALSDLSLIHI